MILHSHNRGSSTNTHFQQIAHPTIQVMWDFDNDLDLSKIPPNHQSGINPHISYSYVSKKHHREAICLYVD